MKRKDVIKRIITGIGTAAFLGCASIPFYSLAEDTPSGNEAGTPAEDTEEETLSENEAGELPEDGAEGSVSENGTEEEASENGTEDAVSENEAGQVSENSAEEAVSENGIEESAEAAAASEEEEASGGEEKGKPAGQAVYTGITIDGDLSDWDAVPKYNATGTLQLAAAVQDENYVYLYIRDDGNCCAAWAGPHTDGKFSFVSDLGYTTIFQLKNNPAQILGVDGASAAYSFEWGDAYGEWEIAVPVDHLPENIGSYSFGFYQGDRFVEGITDVRYSGKKGGDFNGIVYDGLYGDWTDYPHVLIHYATDGTEEKVVDGEGALYTQGDVLYGHCITIMDRHQLEGGNEMLEGVVLRINKGGSPKNYFEFRYAALDAEGNIDWHPQLENLPVGDYEFILTDVHGWGNAKNLKELQEQGVDRDGYYGRVHISVRETSDECEWWCDLPLLAERLGVDVTDIKTIEVKYEQIGDRWIETAGASSGAVAGIAICASVAAMAVLRRRKRGEEV